jgi:hypothetical protein
MLRAIRAKSFLEKPWRVKECHDFLKKYGIQRVDVIVFSDHKFFFKLNDFLILLTMMPLSTKELFMVASCVGPFSIMVNPILSREEAKRKLRKLAPGSEEYFQLSRHFVK